MWFSLSLFDLLSYWPHLYCSFKLPFGHFINLFQKKINVLFQGVVISKSWLKKTLFFLFLFPCQRNILNIHVRKCTLYSLCHTWKKCSIFLLTFPLVVTLKKCWYFWLTFSLRWMLCIYFQNFCCWKFLTELVFAWLVEVYF